MSNGSNSWLLAMSSSEWACELNDTDHDWHADAACRGLGNHLFFFERGDNHATIEASKEFCKACVVRERCLEYAMNNNIVQGIWGGATPNDRRLMGQNKTKPLGEHKIAMVRDVRMYKADNHPSPLATVAREHGVSKATVHRAVQAVELYEIEAGEIIA